MTNKQKIRRTVNSYLDSLEWPKREWEGQRIYHGMRKLIGKRMREATENDEVSILSWLEFQGIRMLEEAKL
jgi:uncharacterized protein YggL (DUF469 family)